MELLPTVTNHVTRNLLEMKSFKGNTKCEFSA